MPRLSLFLLLVVVLLLIVIPSSAQVDSGGVEAAIEDNSFMVEEAFNQEKDIIQHINTYTHTWDNRGWLYTFTDEWPFPGHERHQLSVTVPALESTDYPGSGGGIGDILLNYRYQLIGGGGKKVSFSPRFTLIAPTGSVRYGRGNGGVGLQTNLPLSVYVNRKFITHWNAGATVVPSARDEFGNHATTNGYNLGQSMIWLAHPRFNVMLETIWVGSQTVVGPGQTQRSHDLLIGPGIRWAHNFKNGLQIVPGVSVPIGIGPSAGERGISFYLSFEHSICGTKAK